MSQRVFTSLAMAAALAVVCVTPAAAQEPVRVGGDIKEPRRITSVAPVYPPIAQQAGVQGIVIIEAIIGTDGAVESARVLRPVPLLDQAALDAVTQWRYTPTLLNGQPVKVVMTVTVSFNLGGGTEAPKEATEAPKATTEAPKQEPDVVGLLDYAKAVHQRGLYDEAERTLQRALAVVQADRARAGAQGAASTANANAPLRVGGVVKEPALLTRVDPVYAAGTVPAGVTIAEIVIGGDGRVTEVKILRSSGATVDAAAIAALRQWVFRPTLLNSAPVPVIMTVTIK